MKVDDELRRCGSGWLRLAGSVAVEHGLRHEFDEAEGVIAVFGVAAAMFEESGWIVEDGLEAIAFGVVFFAGEGLTVEFYKARDRTLRRGDDDACGFAPGVDLVHAIAYGECSVVVDDVELAGFGSVDPVERRNGLVGLALWGGLVP